MKSIIIYLFLVIILHWGSNQSLMGQVQIGSDIDGEAAYNYSGYCISMPDADNLAIGAYGNSNYAGHVRVYNWNGLNWIQKGADLDGAAADYWFGYAVSMPDSNTIGIGAPNNNSYSGHVGVYRWVGNAWVQKGNDINGEASNDQSGVALSMPDSNTVAIGSTDNGGNGVNAGHVRVFRWNGNIWVQKGSDIDGEFANDNSGHSVFMSDSNTLAIGSPYNDGNGTDAGDTRIFKWNGASWVQKGTNIYGEAAGDLSGCSVWMPDSNTVAIGAKSNDGNGLWAGHVRIYYWDGIMWIQKGDDIDGEAASNYSGYSISMPNSNIIAIGAFGNHDNGTLSGQVRIYIWDGTYWTQIGNDINGENTGDESGRSISMPDEYTVAIGAHNNDGNGANSGHVRVYSLLGVNIPNNESERKISVFPNPFKDGFCINLKKSYDIIKIKTRNMLGQEISTQVFTNTDKINYKLIGPSGVYFVEINLVNESIILKAIKH